MIEREFKIPVAAPIRSMGVGRRFLFLTIFIVAYQSFNSVPSQAQWKPLLTWYHFYDVYFIDLPGPPRIGFALSGIAEGYDTGFFKTTDGGQTWRMINVPLYSNGGLEFCDIVFKDSLTGWMSVAGSDFYGGCVKTTDGGETWSSVLSGSESYALAIYYNKESGGLFLSTYGTLHGGWNLVSWDKGATWSNQTSTGYLGYSGIAFATEDSGIMADNDIWVPAWFRTTDGGNTWNTIAMDSDVWQPLAIRGTQTYFANTFGGNTFGAMVLRTNDSWNTWKVIYQFPWQPFPYNGFGTQSPGCIRGDSNKLIVQNCGSFYRSTDQGLTWQSLCGPGWANGAKRFYVKGNFIYADADDSIIGSDLGTIWRLNLDSLNIFSSSVTHASVVGTGNHFGVTFQPQPEPSAMADTVHFAFRYDSSLVLTSLQFPPGWQLLDSSSRGDTLLVTIYDTSSTVDTPSVTLNFQYYLTSSATSGMVWLDSANLSGKWMNCDIYAGSVTASDSVRLDFGGCGDSILVRAMEGQPLFTIVSIVPNPAVSSVQINLNASVPVSYTLYDVLGETRLSGIVTSNALDVSSLPSGIYYLRLSSEGFVESREVSIER